MSADLARPRGLPAVPAALFGLLAMVGVVVFLGGVLSSDPDTVARTYRVFLHNWLLWAALSQGALVHERGCCLYLPKPGYRACGVLGEVAQRPRYSPICFDLWCTFANLVGKRDGFIDGVYEFPNRIVI